MANNRARAARDERRRRRVIATPVAGLATLLGALLPAVASAQETRVLEQPDNFGTMVLFTALGSGAVLLLASLGRLYQRQRNIHWRFQDPDDSHDIAGH